MADSLAIFTGTAYSEAKEADCGLAFGKDRAAVFCRGEILETADTEKAIELLMDLIRTM